MSRLESTLEELTTPSHLRDLFGVQLIDPSWLMKLPPELADRLKQILDTPEA